MEFDEFLSGYKPTPAPPSPHPPTKKTFFITSDYSHCIVLNELGSHGGCRRVFLDALSKFFLMNYHDWQSLPRPISSRISSSFRLHG